jgi:CheY-like chemotaxis protein
MTDPKHILLAEDNPNDVELTLEGLSFGNLANHVTVVSDGEAALDYLYRRGRFAGRAGNDPAVVLLDLKMPRVDGLEVLRVVKADPAVRHIPIVMLTSSREERDVVESYELGVNAFVVKPVEFREFISTIKQVGVFWGLINEPPARRESHRK